MCLSLHRASDHTLASKARRVEYSRTRSLHRAIPYRDGLLREPASGLEQFELQLGLVERAADKGKGKRLTSARCSRTWESDPVRNPVEGAQFRRDVKLAQKRGKDMAKLREVLLLLIEGTPLPPRYKDHPLGGDNLHFVRTGTHSDLF
jgi:mRNA interferase YafQ